MKYKVHLHTVGKALIAWFNDYTLGKSGQIVNPKIYEGRPHKAQLKSVSNLHNSIQAHLCLRIY